MGFSIAFCGLPRNTRNRSWWFIPCLRAVGTVAQNHLKIETKLHQKCAIWPTSAALPYVSCMFKVLNQVQLVFILPKLTMPYSRIYKRNPGRSNLQQNRYNLMG